MEEMMLGDLADDTEEFWQNVLDHQNDFWKKNNLTAPTEEEREIFKVLARAKRQAGFPGVAKDDNK
jgi:hypothetical protein